MVLSNGHIGQKGDSSGLWVIVKWVGGGDTATTHSYLENNIMVFFDI